MDRCHTRLANGQRAGFIKHHGVDGLGPLQCHDIADQNPRFCAGASARDQCGWRRQPQCTGASDNQHRDRGHQRCCHRATNQQPDAKGGKGDHHHHRHKYLRYPVHQLLDRRFANLRLLNHIGHLGQGGILTHPRGADFQHPAAIDRTGDNLIPDNPQYRHGFTGDQRLVKLAFTLDDHPVHRHPATGAQQCNIADLHRFNRFHNLTLIGDDGGTVWPQAQQFTQGRAGRALGFGLDIFTHQDQRDNHGRGLKIKQAGRGAAHGDNQPKAIKISRRGAHGHQQVHIARLGLQRMPCPFIIARPDIKLHRRGQQHFAPWPDMETKIKQHRKHLRHQWQGQQDRENQRVFQLFEHGLFCRVVIFRILELCPVSSLFNHFDQGLRAGDGRVKLDRSSFQRKVYSGLRNPRRGI